jgi:hypothetical protein
MRATTAMLVAAAAAADVLYAAAAAQRRGNTAGSSRTRRNSSVLFVMADDLRPELGAYGCAHMITPHLDAFAADPATTVFTRAYVSVAWCSPSRTAILTSRRPDTSMTWSVTPHEYWRQRGGNFTTLPQYFRDELGYLTLGIGKLFHPGEASGNNDVQFSWSDESLPYDDTGARCPSAGAPPPAPAAHEHYDCRAGRCIQLADQESGGAPDPACGGGCPALGASEWLAVRRTSSLDDGGMTLVVVNGSHGSELGQLKKSERLATELPASMVRQVHAGQR